MGHGPEPLMSSTQNEISIPCVPGESSMQFFKESRPQLQVESYFRDTSALVGHGAAPSWQLAPGLGAVSEYRVHDISYISMPAVAYRIADIVQVATHAHILHQPALQHITRRFHLLDGQDRMGLLIATNLHSICIAWAYEYEHASLQAHAHDGDPVSVAHAVPAVLPASP